MQLGLCVFSHKNVIQTSKQGQSTMITEEDNGNEKRIESLEMLIDRLSDLEVNTKMLLARGRSAA